MFTLEEITTAVKTAIHGFPVKSIVLFGSYADGTNTPNSDIDLLVEFETAAVSLLTLSSLKNRIEETLGIEVDIIHAPLPQDSIIELGKVVQIYAA